MSSEVFLYKQLNQTILDRATFEISPPQVSFTNITNEEEIIQLDNSGNYNMNEIASSWSPEDNDLVINQHFSIRNTNALFGQNGLTAIQNKLAIVLKIYSRSSNFSETKIIRYISIDSKSINITHTETFSKNTLRGILYFEYYLTVQEIKNSLPFQANTVGMLLSSEPLLAYSISIDGDGSEFPIEEISEPGKGLWRIWMNWVDIHSDQFNTTNVKIILNSAHPLYDRLFTNSRNRINRYVLNDIILSSMILIIQKAIIIEKVDISDDTDIAPGSIAQVINYWLTTFDIQVDSLESISNSVRANVDLFREG